MPRTYYPSMTTNNVVEAGAKFKKVTELTCEGNHPDGPQQAVSHFHENGPAVCGTHYARMNKAEKAAKKGHERQDVLKAMNEPAPTKKPGQNTRSQANYSLANLEVPEHVGIWVETAAKIRKMNTEELMVEILTEYYNQTCPDYFKEESEEASH